jgi:hypothetical protein
VNVRTLLREVEKLEARRSGQRASIPADRVAFARALGLEPDPWQERLLRSSSDRTLLNCCRQSGKSTMAAVMALHRALTVPGSLVLCLAPALRQSQELFGKVSGYYRDLGRPVPADAEQRLGLELANRSRIAALPGSERTVRGFSAVDLLIVDEAARVDDALVHSVRPMLAVSAGAMMLLSTPYGRRGIFYEEWTGSEPWERFEVPASECPRIPRAFLEAERRSMPEYWFAQEFLCEFRETEDQLWTHEMIEGARDDELAEYRFEGDEELWNTA